MSEEIHADVVVVGGGVAGLRTALALSPLRVVLLSKSAFGGGGSSPYAQGGIAAAVGDDDSPAAHCRDTLAVGADLNSESIVELVTAAAPAAIAGLEALGTRFDRDPDGALALGREAGHSRNRVLHAGGDATGREMMRSLSRAVLRAPGVEVWDRVFARDLLMSGDRVVGVEVDLGDGTAYFLAPAVVLATGGGGQLFRYTTNPYEVTADGLAMAVRAGAAVVDLEFIQFHPTALVTDRDPLPLLTEALRGEGVPIVDELGARFLTKVHRDAELAPRDVVARAIFDHRERGHRAFLDTRRVPGLDLAGRFPTVLRSCLAAGIDPEQQSLPVTPAAHYFMGGVKTDARARSSLDGLWACGEVASTGAHGANRLASNSLLEAVVFGDRAARDIRDRLGAPAGPFQPGPRSGSWVAQVSDTRELLRQLMWRHAGLSRDADGLLGALGVIETIELRSRQSDDAELRNMVTVARVVVSSALAREESRGAHFRRDFQGSSGTRRRHMQGVDYGEEPRPATVEVAL